MPATGWIGVDGRGKRVGEGVAEDDFVPDGVEVIPGNKGGGSAYSRGSNIRWGERTL